MPTKRRNTKAVWFSEEEYQEILAAAQPLGVFPRQIIMIKIRGKS